MIDWLTLVAPMPHDAPIGGGVFLSIAPDGSIEWLTTRRKSVEGSYSSKLTVRTDPTTLERCSHIEISANPVRWFQGHNLWGTEDLPALAVAFLEEVAQVLEIPVADATRAAWHRGEIQVRRVDVTESFHLENLGEVLAWLRSAEQTAHLAHRGRGQLVKGSTLYFGQNSRRWTLKMYAKGQELRDKKNRRGVTEDLPWAREWADRALRAELTIRSMELKRLGLSSVKDWASVDGPPVNVGALLLDKLGSLTMTTTQTLDSATMESLRPALRLVVQSWESGADLRATLPRATFYKYRADLLPHGIDIATRLPKEISNVVPLYRVLEAKPAPVPDWAVGTPLYFEPRRIA